MIYYKLTCIKDMPGCKKGFSYTFMEYYLNRPAGSVLFSSDKKEDRAINLLLEYQDDSEFVRKEYDFSEAVRVLCPDCKERTMFSDSEERQFSDDGVTRWYKEIFLVCAKCRKKVFVSSVCTKTKVSW